MATTNRGESLADASDLERLAQVVEQLEALLTPPKPKSRAERAAELGLHVVREDHDDG